jgi:hypothetical protein
MEAIVKKLTSRTAEPGPGGVPGSLQAHQDREITITLDAESLDGMKKKAIVTLEQPVGSTFSILCDEGAYLAGEDSAPPPLAYFSAGIAF